MGKKEKVRNRSFLMTVSVMICVINCFYFLGSAWRALFATSIAVLLLEVFDQGISMSSLAALFVAVIAVIMENVPYTAAITTMLCLVAAAYYAAFVVDLGLGSWTLILLYVLEGITISGVISFYSQIGIWTIAVEMAGLAMLGILWLVAVKRKEAF